MADQQLVNRRFASRPPVSAGSSEVFTLPPRSINRFLSSVVTCRDTLPCGFSQVVDIQSVSESRLTVTFLTTDTSCMETYVIKEF